jgi:hypothetical protein
MSATKRRTKRYRPRPVYANATDRAFASASPMTAAEVRELSLICEAALTGLLSPASTEEEAGRCWGNLATAASMCQRLSALGLGCGEQAEAVIEGALAALQAVHDRGHAGNGWTMSPQETDAITWLVHVYTKVQLPATSYGEFARAFQATKNHVINAKAAPAAMAG